MVDLSDAVNSQLHMSFNGVSDSEVTVEMHQRQRLKGNCDSRWKSKWTKV